jgi:hypothetical protein
MANKPSKHQQLFKLIDGFIDNYPETSLAQEWREQEALGYTSMADYSVPVLRLECELPNLAQRALGVIKPLLGL